MSRRAALGWTTLLLVPNLLWFGWLFRATSPWQYLADLYSQKEETPFVYGLPPVMLAACALLVFLKARSGAVFSKRRLLLSGPRKHYAIAFFCVCVFIVFQLSWLGGTALFEKFGLLVYSAGTLTAATGLGARLLACRWIGLGAKRFESPLELLVLSCAAGLGALALIVFALGTLGVLHRVAMQALLLGLLAWNFSSARQLFAEFRQAAGGLSKNESIMPFALILFVVLLLLLHLPLLGAAPTDYDVLEYHLAAPAQYMNAGSVSFLRENIYADFPQNGEMLYLFGLINNFTGERFGGLAHAHALLLAAWVLSIAGVYVLARRMARSIPARCEGALGHAPAAAAVLYALIPMGSQLAADFYVEHFQALFHIAALICACAYFSEQKQCYFFDASAEKSNADSAKNDPRAWLAAAGLFAGLCCGSKYMGLLFTLLPLLIFVPVLSRLNEPLAAAWGTLWRVALPAALVFAPWAVRNAWAAADPLYPLGLVLRRRLSGPSGAPDRIDHFEAAHRAGEFSLRAAWGAMQQLMPGLRRENYLNDVACGPQLGFFALPGLAAVANVETALIALVFLTDVLLWFFFSNRINRLFFPLLGPLAALGGLGLARVWEIASLRKAAVGLLCAAVLLFTPLQLAWVWLYSSREALWGDKTFLDSARRQFMFTDSAELFDGVRAAAAIAPNSRVLFVGEARTFYCGGTPAYSVVFNRSMLEEAVKLSKTADGIQTILKQRGVTHLYFNYSEWMRLDTTYALRSIEGEARWELAQWSPEISRMLTGLLRVGRFSDYAGAWPERIYPAYLKLNQTEYARLEKFIKQRTKRTWPPENETFGVCELRVIE